MIPARLSRLTPPGTVWVPADPLEPTMHDYVKPADKLAAIRHRERRARRLWPSAVIFVLLLACVVMRWRLDFAFCL